MRYEINNFFIPNKYIMYFELKGIYGINRDIIYAFTISQKQALNILYTNEESKNRKQSR